ncbi:MAG: sensor histidine kinase, partial [Planctomycetota bacterium]
AAIHANAQLLRDGYCGELPDKALDVLKRITARCHRLTAEIQEMLQLANLSSISQGQLEQQELDLAEMLQWAIDQTEALAQDREVRIDSDLQSARAFGVDDHFKMLLGNLVTNAVIYSHRHGRVTVTCRPAADGTEVTIADEGIGINAQKLPHIFDEHYRTSQAVQHNRESSGLGLAIVRQVAEDHRIRLHVESQLGVGTTFRLQFPSERPPTPPARA